MGTGSDFPIREITRTPKKRHKFNETEIITVKGDKNG